MNGDYELNEADEDSSITGINNNNNHSRDETEDHPAALPITLKLNGSKNFALAHSYNYTGERDDDN